MAIIHHENLCEINVSKSFDAIKNNKEFLKKVQVRDKY